VLLHLHLRNVLQLNVQLHRQYKEQQLNQHHALLHKLRNVLQLNALEPLTSLNLLLHFLLKLKEDNKLLLVQQEEQINKLHHLVEINNKQPDLS
jgi:hypothetical protein